MHDIQIIMKRLLLHPLKSADAEQVFECVSDERVSRYMVYTTYADFEQVRTWLVFIENDISTYHFGFERISDRKLIGSGDDRLCAQQFGARKFASGNVMKSADCILQDYEEEI